MTAHFKPRRRPAPPPPPELPLAQPEAQLAPATHYRTATPPEQPPAPRVRDRHADARNAIAAALPLAGTAAALRIAEVEGFPARHAPELPAPWSVVARALHARVRLLVTTSVADYAAARGRGWNVITGGEWLALTYAAEQMRGNYFELHKWLELKRVDPSHEITPDRAMGGYVTPDKVVEPLPTMGAVFAAWGLQLVHVAETDPMTEGDYADH